MLSLHWGALPSSARWHSGRGAGGQAHHLAQSPGEENGGWLHGGIENPKHSPPPSKEKQTLQAQCTAEASLSKAAAAAVNPAVAAADTTAKKTSIMMGRTGSELGAACCLNTLLKRMMCALINKAAALSLESTSVRSHWVCDA